MKFALWIVQALAFLCAILHPLQRTAPAAEPAPVRTRQVDPKDMERAKPVENPAPFQAELAGTWDIWVPGGIWYSSDGRTIFQNYTPGAAMNRLVIHADGKYEWAAKKGALLEVRPWYAQEGRRYFRIVQANAAEYELFLKDGQLIFLFGGVGGHAATGTQVTPETEKQTSVKPAEKSGVAPPTAADHKSGTKVEVLWNGQWYPATILKTEGARRFIHYEGWNSSWDEWVTSERVRNPAK